MHRSVSGHFGLRLFISEPINVSTRHQIRLGPLTTHQSPSVFDLGVLENTWPQHFSFRHSFVNNKSVYKETSRILLIHYTSVLQEDGATLD